jgi:hypothetical protein
VLDTVEALLLRRRDECPVDEECRRRVAVKGVEAENCGHAALFCQSHVDDLLGASPVAARFEPLCG